MSHLKTLYVPNVVLHSLYVPLPFPNELTPVFAEGYFDLDYSNPKYREHGQRLL